MLSPDDGTARWWSCTRKHKYATEQHAKEVAADRLKKRNAKLATYECKYCGCWHLRTVRR